MCLAVEQLPNMLKIILSSFGIRVKCKTNMIRLHCKIEEEIIYFSSQNMAIKYI